MDRFGSEDVSTPKRPGIFVPTRWAIAYVLLSVLIAVVIGLIVNFAISKEIKFDCNRQEQAAASSGTLASTLEKCFDGCRAVEQKATAADSASSPKVTTTPKATAMPNVTATVTENSTSTGPKPSKPNMRLPTAVVPNRYDIELRPDIYQVKAEDFTFNGTVSIHVTCKNSTSTIVLHQNQLEISSYTLIDDSKKPANITSYNYDNVTQFMVFNVSPALIKDTNYTLIIMFSSKLRPDLRGLYYSSYNDNGTTKYIATTQMEPTDARKAFPCFDEPAMKAIFSVSVWRKKNMTALSNMPIEKTTPQNETQSDWVMDKFKDTLPMSTYLVAFVVCDFQNISRTTRNGTVMRVWARRESIEQAEYALNVSVNITEYFEQLFGQAFPLPKQDLIAIPDFAAGAMENWGLITYRETSMLYHPTYASASNKQRVAVVVSHELAHQWFGNLVSPEWWDDLWLNEGFASYVEYLGVDYVHNDWEMLKQILIEDVFPVKYDDSLSTSHPLYVPVNDPEEINSIFDSISYAKGASIIRQFNFAYGESVFTNGIKKYFEQRRFRNANKGHLWDAWNQVANSGDPEIPKVNEFMDTWTNQMGYPLISVKYVNSTAVQVTQEHFLLNTSKSADPRYPSPYGYRWYIPLTTASDTDANASISSKKVQWMKPTDKTKTILLSRNKWFIINVGSYGLYRVHYEERVWDELAAQLNNSHTVIHENNRAQLINDAFNLVKANKLSIGRAMTITKYLGGETAYVPMVVALTELNEVDRLIDGSSAYGSFEEYMKTALSKLYESIGRFAGKTGGHVDELKQILITPRACRYNVGDCREQARRWFSSWMDSTNRTAIPPNLRSTVYCYGVKLGDKAEWEYVYNEFTKQANVPTEAARLLEALSCTEKHWLLQRTLEYSLDASKIRKQDAVNSIVYVSRNTIGKPLAWNFIREKWDFMYTEYGGGSFSLPKLISEVLRNFKSKVELDEVLAFGEKIGDKLGTAQRAFEQAKERIQNNIEFLDQNENAVIEWLKTNSV